MKQVLLAMLTFGCFSAFGQINVQQLEIATGSPAADPTNLFYDGSVLYFYGDDSSSAGDHGRELWKVEGDGTPTMVADLNSGAGDGNDETSRSRRQMASRNGKLYFAASDGTTGMELWEYDGSNAPKRLTDQNPGSEDHNPRHLIHWNNKIYYAGYDTVNGRELYAFDPGTGQTTRLSDINTGTGSSNVEYLTPFKGKLYFAASDGNTGRELYSYDPSNNSVTMVADIDTGNGGAYNSYPNSFLVHNDKLYFSADNEDHGAELYVYDGVVAPTRLTDIKTGTGQQSNSLSRNLPYSLIVYFGDIFMCARDDNSGYELYRYQIGSNTVTMAHEFNAGGSNGYPYYFTIYNNILYFNASDGTNGSEMWKFSGYDSKATMVQDLNPGSGNGRARETTLTHKYMYFVGNNGNDGQELFRMYDSTLSINNVRFDADINVYPNPASNVATLEIKLKRNQSLSVTMSDMAGRVVYRTPNTVFSTGSHKVELPVQNLPTGSYSYTIFDSNGAVMHSGKLQKQ